MRAAAHSWLSTRAFHDADWPDERTVAAMILVADAYLAGRSADEPAVVWTDEQCLGLNAHQHNRHFHPMTCGNGCRRIPLIATRYGWRCADCDYRQNWAHPIPTSESRPC